MIRLYGFSFSTNVERVTLALAHKGLQADHVHVPYEDRSEVQKVSGQPLVPVIEDRGKVIHDSMEIVRYLEEAYPEKPLYPKDPARKAEMLIFIDWFNRVWKRPPNDIVSEMEKIPPDQKKIAEWGESMTQALGLFEEMLSDRAYLMGEFSAADCAAFPFLKYALLPLDKSNSYPFHRFHQVLVKYMPLGTQHPRLTKWIRRVDEHPRA